MRSTLHGALAWKTSKGREYLVHSWYDSETGTKRSRSMGPRSPKTEQEKLQFDRGREAADKLLVAAKAPLERLSRIAKALHLGRLDNMAADILRELRNEHVLGPNCYVVDSTMVAGYEAQASAFLPKGFGSPSDHLHLCTVPIRDEGLLEATVKACRRVDSSFRVKGGDSILGERFAIQVFSRRSRFDLLARSRRFDRDQLDVLADAIYAHPIRTIAIARNGMPVEIVGPDPRDFALVHYACGVGGLEHDEERAFAVGRLVEKFWPEKFSPGVAEAFPEFAAGIGMESPRVEDPDAPDEPDPDESDPDGPRFFGP